MGLFKDIRRMQKQAGEMTNAFPVKERMAGAAEAMARANEALASMSTSTHGATNAAVNGVDAVATVTTARQTGALVNHNPVIELGLIVMMPTGVPVPVTIHQTVQMLHLARAQIGTRLPVKVDPADANSVWIDWDAPPPA